MADASRPGGASTVPARGIQRIEKSSVHRICSGQVILDPSSALKELVENAVDAGASKVEVRLKEYGLESLEVVDNGSGVKPEDYELLAKKHTTSKLANFDDLARVSTFGFRGEALSSLCAICDKVQILTRTSEQLVGTKLEYDRNGTLTSTSNCAREVGTTVTLLGLFHSLPVRLKDFQKNKTREFQRLLRKLQAYAIIHCDVRMICKNQTPKSNSAVLSTPGNNKLLDSITSVFGAKIKDALTELSVDCPGDVSVKGLISKSGQGCGLSSGDRQFLFLNKRPVDVPKLTKAINEVYKSFNMHQFPMLFLNIAMPTAAYDVNVTPDKRTVMLHDEKRLVEAVKDGLKEFYEPTRGTMSIQSFTSLKSRKTSEEGDEESGLSQNAAQTSESCKRRGRASIDDTEDEEGGRSQTETSAGASSGVESTTPSQEPQTGGQHAASTPPSDSSPTPDPAPRSSKAGGPSKSRAGGALTQTLLPATGGHTSRQPRSDLQREGSDSESEHSTGTPAAKRQREGSPAGSEKRVERRSSPVVLQQRLLDSRPLKKQRAVEVKAASDEEEGAKRRGQDRREPEDASTRDEEEEEGTGGGEALKRRRLTVRDETEDEAEAEGRESEGEKKPARQAGRQVGKAASSPLHGANRGGEGEQQRGQAGSSKKRAREGGEEEPRDAAGMRTPEQGAADQEEEEDGGVVSDGCDAPQTHGGVSTRVHADWSAIAQRQSQLLRRAAQPEQGAVPGDASAQRGRGRAEGAEGAATDLALRQVAKEDFGRMEVLGQFNLGFIIGRLGVDLYILDQHACDEKFRYETLQKTTTINSQRLVVPHEISLEAPDEMVVQENLEIFRASGFDFEVRPDLEPGSRVRLTAVPFSKGTVFGASDVHEMVCLLRDNPGVACRPSRVSAMFASRACRSAIMIGTALNQQQMVEVKDHMGTMEQPWNCPHGRPTMRHLYDLAAVLGKAKRSASYAYKGPAVVR